MESWPTDQQQMQNLSKLKWYVDPHRLLTYILPKLIGTIQCLDFFLMTFIKFNPKFQNYFVKFIQAHTHTRTHASRFLLRCPSSWCGTTSMRVLLLSVTQLYHQGPFRSSLPTSTPLLQDDLGREAGNPPWTYPDYTSGSLCPLCLIQLLGRTRVSRVVSLLTSPSKQSAPQG